MSIVLHKQHTYNDVELKNDMEKLIERNKYLEKMSIYLLKNMHNSIIVNKTQSNNYNALSKILDGFTDTMEELSLEISNNSLCEICYKNNANVILGGCSHKICLLCAENIDPFSKQCPYDRIAYDTVRCITCDKEIDKFKEKSNIFSDSDSDLESDDGESHPSNTNMGTVHNIQIPDQELQTNSASSTNWFNPLVVCKKIWSVCVYEVNSFQLLPTDKKNLILNYFYTGVILFSIFRSEYKIISLIKNRK